MPFSSYFSARHILSKGATINCAFSDRSDGKTFDCKLRALEDYRDHRHVTLYVRRWKTEMDETFYMTFFDEVLRQECGKPFRKWEFKHSKSGVKVKLPESEEWDNLILFMPLTMSGKKKSQFNGIYHRIFMIDYDEFFPLDGQYIKGEVTSLLELWKSVDRDREVVQIMVLGNKITPFNPIFDYFNIRLSLTKDKIRTYRDDTLAVQIYSNKEHREKRKEGKFAKLVSGTPYEAYDQGGILNMLDLKIKSRTGMDYLFSFKSETGEGSIWYKNGQFVISEYKRLDGQVITDKAYNTGRDEYVVKLTSIANMFRRAYQTGNLYFENENAFNKFEPILLKCNAY